jgi:Zn-dependent peptidase ImmA (M78 family)/transcriptional regulator with XRE-family HTH domain
MPKVNPEILRWARESAGLSLEQAVQKLDISDARGVAATDRLAALEAGAVEPSRPMVVRMAKQYRRPLLAFYLPSPPRKGDRGQDFRTLPEDYSPSNEAILDALISDLLARQALVRAALEDEDESTPLAFIGSASLADGVTAVVTRLRAALNLSLSDFRAAGGPEEAFRLLRRSTEGLGVFVVLASNLGSHHTALSLETFRGFAVADPIAPFIVVNDQDSRAAWSFTLLHELAHLWLGYTGISGGGIPDRDVEQFCNEVASEFLVPSEELSTLLEPEGTPATLEERISEFSAARNVSRSMVAYKLYRRGLISIDQWLRVSALFRRAWLEQRERRREATREESGGPSYYVVRRHRLGDALLFTTARLLAAGALTTTKAGRVLGVKPNNVQALMAGVRGFGRASR